MSYQSKQYSPICILLEIDLKNGFRKKFQKFSKKFSKNLKKFKKSKN